MNDEVGICKRCGKPVGKWDGYFFPKDKSYVQHITCPDENPQTGLLEKENIKLKLK